MAKSYEKEQKDGYTHRTTVDGNRRSSYDIKPDKNGGWSIKDAHVTNTDLGKHDKDRHNPNH